MIHPLFRLIAAEPQMVADHLGGYCALFGDELRSMSTQWARRLALQVAAIVLLAVALALAGVAVMLWAVMPSAVQAAWALAVVPLVPVTGAVMCHLAARGDAPSAGFAAMRRQIDADVQMLREAGAA
jgi:cytochrome bd-type quinol oxidase subunit 2